MRGIERRTLELPGRLTNDVEDAGDGGGVEELDFEESRLEHLVKEEGGVGVEKI